MYEVGLFVHVPFAHVSVEPLVVAPEIDGSAVFEGGDGAAVTLTGLEVALPDPPAFVAVTTQRIAVPTAWAITYVALVCPAIGVPFAVHA